MNKRLRRRVRGTSIAPDTTEFQSFASLKSVDSGEQVVTFGIPFEQSVAVTTARRTRIVARYEGSYLPVQTEHFQSRVTGELSHCAAHVVLPSTYSARSKVEIGYSDTYTQPSPPDWTAITSAGDDFRLLVTLREPRVHYLALDKAPAGGDTLTITFTHASGGTTSYTETFTPGDKSDRYRHKWGDNLYAKIAEQISQDTSGRYICRDRLAAQAKPWNFTYPSTRFNGYDKNGAPFWNTAVYAGLGGMNATFGNDGAGSYAQPPYATSSAAAQWPTGGGGTGCALYMWTRPGVAYGDYTVSAAVQRNGTRLPVTSFGTIGEGWKRLNYRDRTATFTRGDANEVRTLKGLTSGTTAAFKPDAVSAGTTGWLEVDGICGPGFIDGEILVSFPFQNVQETLGAGSATVDGALQYQTITASTGGDAQFICVDTEQTGSGYTGSHVHVINVSGVFASGATLTSPYGTCTMTGSPLTSDFSFYNTATTTAQSATLTPLNNYQSDVQWEFVFNDEAESVDSPWFDGHQARQIVKRGPLKKVSDGTDHPHLIAEMLVSFDRDGNVFDRQVILSNPKPNAQSRDYWGDLAVEVNGVNQVSGNSNWTYKYIGVHESARWSMSRPAAHCDPVNFMRAGLVRGFHRYPDWDAVFEFKGKLVGSNLYSETNFTVPGSSTAPLFGMPVMNEIGVPFYPAPFAFHSGGGSRPELGDLNTIEYGFWASDSLLMQPVLEAMADNAMGAQGFNLTLEDATGDDKSNPPNVYDTTNWQYHPATGSVSSHKYSRHREYSSQVQAPVSQLYTLRSRFDPKQSHSCSTGAFSAYLIRPEKRYFDMQREFAWYQGMNGPGGNRLNGFRSGAAAGDATHRMQFTAQGGPRSFSRVARDWCFAAGVSFEGSRQRDMWRRIAGDMAFWANEAAENTLWGLWFGNHNIESDYDLTQPFPDNTEGQTITGSFVGGGMPPHGLSQTIGAFQELFISLMCFNAHNIGAADFSTFLSLHKWAALGVSDPPHGDWWNAVPGAVDNKHPYQVAENFVFSGSEPRAPSLTANTWNSWADLRAHVETFTDPAQRLKLGVYSAADVWDADVTPGTAAYSIPRMFYGALLSYSIFGADAGLRAACVSAMSEIDAQAPANTPYSFFGSYTYAKIWQQTGATDPALESEW